MIEIKFKNGSKLENIESKDSKRSYPKRIKFGELETTTPVSSKEIYRNQILYYQKHPEEFLELMGHDDLHLYWYQKLLIRIVSLYKRKDNKR